jgi:Ca-activated chloride channel family protein
MVLSSISSNLLISIRESERFWRSCSVHQADERKAASFSEPFMRLLCAALLSLCLVLPAAAAERAMLVLDSSGSMYAQLGGVPRIVTLRQTLDEVLAALPPGLELGLSAFGTSAKGACNDVTTLVPVGPDTGAAITAAAAGILPKGKTSIADALQKSAEALDYTREKATVVLLVDGLDGCGGDVCSVARDLEIRGRDFTAHLIGFGLSEIEGEQLSCIAKATGGQYFSSPDNAGFGRALTASMYAAANQEMPPPPPEPLAVNFDPELFLAEGAAPLPADAPVNWEIKRGDEYVASGYGLDWTALLEPGTYTALAKLGYATAESQITVDAFTLAAPRLLLDGGRLTIRPLGASGEPDANAYVTTTFATGEAVTNYGETTLYVPAGTIDTEVTIGSAKASESIAIAAGEALVRDISVAVGHISLQASLVAGLRVEDSGLSFSIVAATADLYGYREERGSAYGAEAALDLPPGDYVATVRFDQVEAETPFTVAAGTTQTVEIVLDAGVLAATAPGAETIEIFDQYGAQLGYGYGADRTATVRAGEYRVMARRPDGSEREQTVRVKAGERTAITID